MKIVTKIAKYLLVFIAVIVILNIPATTRYGVDGALFIKKIPLYAKVGGFLYRDWAYRDMVRNITYGKKDDREKAVAILNWTNKNIMLGIPKGLKCVDDHPLNIIIRQYGAKDQVEDVFTILCSYAGMKACVKKCYNADRTRSRIFSFLRVRDGTLIFDAAAGKYFVNRRGGIASIEDYLREGLVLSDEEARAYEEFMPDLKNIKLPFHTRAEEQMPFARIPIQFQRIFGPKKADKRDIDA